MPGKPLDRKILHPSLPPVKCSWTCGTAWARAGCPPVLPVTEKKNNRPYIFSYSIFVILYHRCKISVMTKRVGHCSSSTLFSKYKNVWNAHGKQSRYLFRFSFFFWFSPLLHGTGVLSATCSPLECPTPIRCGPRVGQYFRRERKVEFSLRGGFTLEKSYTSLHRDSRRPRDGYPLKKINRRQNHPLDIRRRYAYAIPHVTPRLNKALQHRRRPKNEK